MVAPFLLIAAPTLGGIWVHPAAHLAIAALVLPIAAFALRSGYRKHGARWIVGLGTAAMVLVLLGGIGLVTVHLGNLRCCAACES